MVRTVETRFRILRNGADFGELYAIGAPTLRMQDSGAIKTSLRGEFAVPEEIDWLSDEIRPELWIDGVMHALGVFLPATVRESSDESTRSVTVEAYDRCWRVRDTILESSLYLASGTNYITAIEQLLAAAGISLIDKTPTTETLQEARQDWEIGTSYLDIINQLLDEINYNELWFNAGGAAVLGPSRAPTADAIDHVFDNTDVKSLLLPTMDSQTDVYSAPNVFLCVCSNPDKSGAMTATAVNDNPQSPLSIMRRGRRICKLVRLQNIASSSALQVYANRLRDQSLFSGETITVQTALLPGFGVADVTALRYDDLAAICVERGWSMSLAVGGTMTHTLERVVSALG